MTENAPHYAGCFFQILVQKVDNLVAFSIQALSYSYPFEFKEMNYIIQKLRRICFLTSQTTLYIRTRKVRNLVLFSSTAKFFGPSNRSNLSQPPAQEPAPCLEDNSQTRLLAGDQPILSLYTLFSLKKVRFAHIFRDVPIKTWKKAGIRRNYI